MTPKSEHLVDFLQEIKKIAIIIINGNFFIIFIFLTFEDSNYLNYSLF